MNPNAMTPIDWAKRPILEKYADFSGRASRAEYWWYTLALVVTFVVLSVIEGILGIKGMVFGVYGPLTCLLWLATIVPGLAVGIRRLHDTNRSGWWILLPIVPYALAIVLGGPAILAGGMGAGLGIAALFLLVGFVCAILLIVFLVMPGTPGENRYGPNPYGESADAVPAE